jgi:serine protein kinase
MERPNISEASITDFIVERNRVKFKETAWEGSFLEYLDLVCADPYRHTRTTYQLTFDMLQHFGSETFEDSGETVRRYKLFNDPFNDGKNAIYGLERTISKLVKYIRAGAREEGLERIFILHGPVGTAKTSIIDLIGSGLEAYSATDEGAAYTFAWRFGKDFHNLDGGSLGFGGTSSQPDYAGVVDPVAVLPSQMREHPLLLIPKRSRRELLGKLFRQNGIEDQYPIPHKILEADLDFNSRQIYDFLMRRYKGDWLKVMEHVQVRRMTFSESGGVGIAKIPPEGNVETASSPVTIDENYKYIANLVGSVNLVRYHGKYVRGNRGIVHYSDIFKKPSNYLQHLLSAVEEHKMDFGEVGCDIDAMILGTSNLAEYQALRGDPLSKALRSRMRKIDVPYLLNYRDEEKIYNRGLRQAKRYHRIAPHTTELASLWAVMSRLDKSELAGAEDLSEEARQVIAKLTPLHKALLYAGEFPPNLTNRERQALSREVRKRLRNEVPQEGYPQGMVGIPTRILQNVFADICEDDSSECITPFAVFKLLDRVVDQGAVNYDFLEAKRNDGYRDFRAFTAILRQRYEDIIKSEVENSIVNVDAADIEKRIRQYLQHVTAFNRKEKLKNAATGDDMPPDEGMMRGIEDMMDVEDSEREFFRFRIVSRLTNAMTGGTGRIAPGGEPQGIDLQSVYQDLFREIHRGLYDEMRDKVNWQQIKRFLDKADTREELDKQLAAGTNSDAAATRTLLDNMDRTYGYCYECAKPIILYFIEKRLG